MKLYCIEIHRELEDVCVEHHRFEKEPTYEEVLEYINTLDLGYDDDYGKFNYYEVKE